MRGITPTRASVAYSQSYDRHIQDLIANFTNIDYLKANTVINRLAAHLKNSPRSYYSNGLFCFAK